VYTVNIVCVVQGLGIIKVEGYGLAWVVNGFWPKDLKRNIIEKPPRIFSIFRLDDGGERRFYVKFYKDCFHGKLLLLESGNRLRSPFPTCADTHPASPSCPATLLSTQSFWTHSYPRARLSTARFRPPRSSQRSTCSWPRALSRKIEPPIPRFHFPRDQKKTGCFATPAKSSLSFHETRRTHPCPAS